MSGSSSIWGEEGKRRQALRREWWWY
jgi:hypothetical protein